MNPGDDELLSASGCEQAAWVRSGRVSSEELTQLYLRQIERLNPALGAFVHVAPEMALREARSCDRAARRGSKLPFLGVPMGIKDLNFARGMPVHFGSRALHFLAPFDDLTVSHLRRAGFVILGKTATSELGTMPVVETDVHPPARNPWNPAYSSGGSSGGAGAAVGADMLPMAQGSDGAGSIRIPSSFNHLYGIKPSRGRVTNSYGMDDRRIIYTCGPMGRSVDDVAAMLDVMAGLTTNHPQPHWAPPPLRSFRELAKRDPLRLRIKFTTKTPLAKTHPEVEAATHLVLKALADAGHQIEEGGPPDASLEEFLPVWQHIAASSPVSDWSLTQPVTRWLADKGRNLTLAEVVARGWVLENRVHDWFGDVDAWVTPTVPAPPPKVGAWSKMEPAEAFANAAELGPFTAPFNVGGHPAASVPVALSSEGLPIGVQIAGKPFADAMVLQLSRQVEERLPWKSRRAKMAR